MNPARHASLPPPSSQDRTEIATSSPYESPQPTAAQDAGTKSRVWLFAWLLGSWSLLVSLTIELTLFSMPGPGIAYWIGGQLLAIIASFRVGNGSASILRYIGGSVLLNLSQLGIIWCFVYLAYNFDLV